LACVSSGVLNGRRTGLGRGFDRYCAPPPDSDRDSSVAVGQLERWLADFDDRPLFVWLEVADAAAPYEPPEEIVWRYYPEDLNPRDPSSPVASLARAPAWDPSIADPMYTEALYDAAVTYLDGVLGNLVVRTRLGEATLAFTADHGETLRKGGDSRFGHRGLSGANLAVPLIFTGPGLGGAEPRTNAVQQSDVGRSLLTLAGHGAEEFPGRDLLSSSIPDDGPRFAVEEEGAGAALLLGDWLVRIPLRDRSAAGESAATPAHRAHLFDLRADPRCQGDLASIHPERTARMRAALMEWLERKRATGWSWVDPDCACPDCRAAR